MKNKRKMIIATTIFPGRCVQDYDALKRLGMEMAWFGQKGLVSCSSFVYECLLRNI